LKGYEFGHSRTDTKQLTTQKVVEIEIATNQIEPFISELSLKLLRKPEYEGAARIRRTRRAFYLTIVYDPLHTQAPVKLALIPYGRKAGVLRRG
jgi:hypothetical protein